MKKILRWFMAKKRMEDENKVKLDPIINPPPVVPPLIPPPEPEVDPERMKGKTSWK